MSKHTPGPWNVEQNGFFKMAVKTESGITITFEAGYGSSVSGEEKEANALLISVSPELYALAERIARLNKDAGEIGAGVLSSLVDEANRIIAKVEQ